jgi:hypothetical protein
MSLYAVRNLDDALAVTRDFLTPLDATRWLKLALVAFFVGGQAAGSNTVQYSVGGNGGGSPATTPGAVEGPRLWILVAVVVAALLVAGLVFALVGSVMEFVFVESLRSGEVTVRRYWRRRWRQGLRLFGFRVALGLFVLVGVALLAAPFVLSVVATGTVGGVTPWLLVAALPFVVGGGVLVAVASGFTTAFVVPVMVLDDGGVLDGWRRLWPTVTAQWTQYLAYAVASVVLSLLGGVAVGVATAALGVVVLLPLLLLGAVGVALLAVAPPVGWAVVALAAVLFVLSLVVVAAVVQVPVKVYLRYYALLVLGDIEAEFDLVPDRRAAVREGEA